MSNAHWENLCSFEVRFMRLLCQSVLALLALMPVLAQTPPLRDPQIRSTRLFDPTFGDGTLELSEAPPPQIASQRTSMRAMIKRDIYRAIDRNCLTVDQWHRLTPKQKFQVFVRHTYAP